MKVIGDKRFWLLLRPDSSQIIDTTMVAHHVLSMTLHHAMTNESPEIDHLMEQGYVLLPQVISAERAQALADHLTNSLQTDQAQGSPLASRGTVYAARNPLEMIDDVASLWRQTPLGPFLLAVLGPEVGLVRGLFFDKPPGRSWWLPWHKDLTIAVKDNELPSDVFTRPTHKGGVPHVIAPVELLQRMLTIRLHLDDVTLENGPLRVIPGSHLSTDEAASSREPATILARAGEALAMRPLLSHSSGDSLPETTRHRRILHLEFAAQEKLPDGYEWQRFMPCDPAFSSTAPVHKYHPRPCGG